MIMTMMTRRRRMKLYCSFVLACMCSMMISCNAFSSVRMTTLWNTDIQLSHIHPTNVKNRMLALRLSSTMESSDNNISEQNVDDVYTSGLHHVAIRTKDIEGAIKFYSLLSFEVEEKYLINGEVRAAWLHNNSTRIELIEVPERILGAPKELVRTADQMKKMNLIGLNHICLDVTQSIRAKQNLKLSSSKRKGNKQWFATSYDEEGTSSSSQCEGVVHADDYQRNAEYGLQEWLLDLEELSKEKFGKTLRIAVEPTSRTIGYNVFDIALIYDADGVLVELLNHVTTVKTGSMRSSWDVLSDEDFIALLKSGRQQES